MCTPTCMKMWATWNWNGYAHCGRCHVTFASVADFDQHRTRRGCLSPEMAGLRERESGVWSAAPSEPEGDPVVAGIVNKLYGDTD